MVSKSIVLALTVLLAVQSANAGFLELDEFAVGFFGYHSVNPQSFLQCWNASTADQVIAAWNYFDEACHAFYDGRANDYSQAAYNLQKIMMEIGSDVACAENSTSIAHVLNHYHVNVTNGNWSNIENDLILYLYEFMPGFWERTEKGVSEYLSSGKYTQAGAYLAANLYEPISNVSRIFNSSNLQNSFFNGLFLAANLYGPNYALSETDSGIILNFISGLANAVNNGSTHPGVATNQYLTKTGLPLWNNISKYERDYLLKDDAGTQRLSKALKIDFSDSKFNESLYYVAYNNSNYVTLMQEAAYYANGYDFFTAGILYENVLELVSEVYNQKKSIDA